MKFRNAMLTGVVLLMTGALAACGGDDGLSGEYGQTNTGQWFTILNFKGSNQVTLTMIGSEDKHNGTYTRDGNKVTVKVAGETRTLQIDGKGCLGGGGSLFSGVVCKKT